MKGWFRTSLWIGGGLCVAACAKELSIGADACPRGASCVVERLDLPHQFVEVHSTGPSLEPAWKASEQQVEGNVAAQIDDSSVLATGSDNLWIFTPKLGAIDVTVLDASGMVVEQRTLESPPGSRLRKGIPPSPRAVASHPRGPVLGLEWSLACPETAPDTSGCSQSLSDMLVFGTEGAEPVSRGSPYPINTLVDTFDTVHRSADGQTVLITGSITGLRKVDLESNLLWTSALSLDQFDELPHTATRQSAVVPFRSGAVSPTGELVFGIDIMLKKSEAWDWRNFPAGLLYTDADGAQSVRLYGAAGGADNPVGEAPEYFAHTALAYDTRGRLLAVYTQLDGDLLVVRITERDVESFRILREDYADLQLFDTAMDPAGTLYIASEGGGRAPDEAVPLLCRVPEEGMPDCVSIPQATYDIEAPAPGVVFAALSGLQRELARFDFQ